MNGESFLTGFIVLIGSRRYLQSSMISPGFRETARRNLLWRLLANLFCNSYQTFGFSDFFLFGTRKQGLKILYFWLIIILYQMAINSCADFSKSKFSYHLAVFEYCNKFTLFFFLRSYTLMQCVILGVFIISYLQETLS